MDSTQTKLFYDNTLVQYRLNSQPQLLCGVKLCVCGHLLAGIVGSNPPGPQMSRTLVSIVCRQVGRSLQRDEHSSRRVLLNVVCLSVIVKPQQWEVPAHKGL
jgi:hypothetical protein